VVVQEEVEHLCNDNFKGGLRSPFITLIRKKRFLYMAKSKATFGKRDKEKKRLEKRQEKADKKEERKANAKKGQSLEDMMVYVDEDGNFTSTPPDPKKKKEINHQEIELDIRKMQAAAEEDARRNGVVTMFNHEKG